MPCVFSWHPFYEEQIYVPISGKLAEDLAVDMDVFSPSWWDSILGGRFSSQPGFYISIQFSQNEDNSRNGVHFIVRFPCLQVHFGIFISYGGRGDCSQHQDGLALLLPSCQGRKPVLGEAMTDGTSHCALFTINCYQSQGTLANSFGSRHTQRNRKWQATRYVVPIQIWMLHLVRPNDAHPRRPSRKSESGQIFMRAMPNLVFGHRRKAVRKYRCRSYGLKWGEGQPSNANPVAFQVLPRSLRYGLTLFSCYSKLRSRKKHGAPISWTTSLIPTAIPAF
ncbi:hypothetical protein CVT26_012978 [Gymnopilus dilepis]|uniref:Uncharacterized protein n=1 Tax=Gymnopilus dilepis TaxID=231916 RepID=A0A409YP38_9AGAR|nr:hypothetical protein CVT26_012978 [Gymnopilus dilepis]